MSTTDGGDHPSPPPARPLRVPRPEDGLAGKRVRSRRLASPARHPVVPVDFHDVYGADGPDAGRERSVSPAFRTRAVDSEPTNSVRSRSDSHNARKRDSLLLS